jgi:PAS domain S-box-containing protein
MAGLTSAELRRFSELADHSPVTMLVIADPGYQILFGANLALLGYADREIKGRNLIDLLPVEMYGRHEQLMEGFKAEALEGASREMGAGRVVPARAKDGSIVKVKIDIAYILTGRNRGYYIGFLQGEGASYVDVPQLYNLKGKLEVLLNEVGKDFWRRVNLAGGGVSGISAVIITFATPVFPALKAAAGGFWSAVTSGVTRESGQDVVITASLSDEQRSKRLLAIRDAIRLDDPELVAVAYYRLEQRVGKLRLHWIDDTEDPSGREVWFYDSVEDKLLLNLSEAEQLLNSDCILKPAAAAMVNRPGVPPLNLILCPTFVIGEQHGLPRAEVKGLIVGAYRKEMKSIEPHAGLLWSYGPALETIMGQ